MLSSSSFVGALGVTHLSLDNKPIKIGFHLNKREELQEILIKADELSPEQLESLNDLRGLEIASAYRSLGSLKISNGLKLGLMSSIEKYWGVENTSVLKSRQEAPENLLCRCSGIFKGDFERFLEDQKGDFKKACGVSNASMICGTCRLDLQDFFKELPNFKNFRNGKSKEEWLEALDELIEKLSRTVGASNFEVTSFDLYLIKIKLIDYRGELKRKELNRIFSQTIEEKFSLHLDVSIFY
jgi:hypothetical protein